MSPDPSTTPDRPSLLPRVRAIANITAGVLAVVVLIGFALGPGHIPEPILGRIGFTAILAFIVGFVAILIENRRSGPVEDEL